jgi:hypothetical protein
LFPGTFALHPDDDAAIGQRVGEVSNFGERLWTPAGITFDGFGWRVLGVSLFAI